MAGTWPRIHWLHTLTHSLCLPCHIKIFHLKKKNNWLMLVLFATCLLLWEFNFECHQAKAYLLAQMCCLFDALFYYFDGWCFWSLYSIHFIYMLHLLLLWFAILSAEQLFEIRCTSITSPFDAKQFSFIWFSGDETNWRW